MNSKKVEKGNLRGESRGNEKEKSKGDGLGHLGTGVPRGGEFEEKSQEPPTSTIESS